MLLLLLLKAALKMEITGETKGLVSILLSLPVFFNNMVIFLLKLKYSLKVNFTTVFLRLGSIFILWMAKQWMKL